jgi:enoyl-CoA hydratase/carnithine racemase
VMRDGRIVKGVPSATGLLWPLPALVGGANASELLFQGVDWSLGRLQELRLVDEVAQAGDEAATGLRLAEDVLKRAPETRVVARQVMWRSLGTDLERGLGPSLETV